MTPYETTLKAWFLQPDYQQCLYRLYHQCQQRERTVRDYAEEIYQLNARTNIVETEDQQVVRFVRGLQESIQDRFSLQPVWKLSDAVNLAQRVEEQFDRSNHRQSSYCQPPPPLSMEKSKYFPSLSTTVPNPTATSNET